MNHDERFGVMIDCQRNAVMNTKSLKKFTDYIIDNNTELVILHKLGHNAWDYAYTNDLLNWLLERDKRKNILK